MDAGAPPQRRADGHTARGWPDVSGGDRYDR